MMLAWELWYLNLITPVQESYASLQPLRKTAFSRLILISLSKISSSIFINLWGEAQITTHLNAYNFTMNMDINC